MNLKSVTVNNVSFLDKARKLYEKAMKEDLAFNVAQQIIEARTIKGITQAQLAKRAKTAQSAIARAEKGKHLPSLSFLDRLAKAMKMRVNLKIE